MKSHNIWKGKLRYAQAEFDHRFSCWANFHCPKCNKSSFRACSAECGDKEITLVEFLARMTLHCADETREKGGIQE